MKEYKVKGLRAILAVALVLGLATSVFATEKLSFGVKGGMGLMAPLIEDGDFLSEDWNDMVDDLNQSLEDDKDWVESAGGTASIDLAEKITRGWDIEGYAQYRIAEMFGLRGSVGYLTGMNSNFGLDADYWDAWLGDWIIDEMTGTISASCLFMSLEPILALPMGNFLLTFGGGPAYYMGHLRTHHGVDWTNYYSDAEFFTLRFKNLNDPCVVDEIHAWLNTIQRAGGKFVIVPDDTKPFCYYVVVEKLKDYAERLIYGDCRELREWRLELKTLSQGIVFL